MPVRALSHAAETRAELVDVGLRPEARYILVGGILAVVCTRCGEQALSSETTEQVCLMVNGGSKTARSSSMPVYDFARH